jgi:hypothetical protein
MKTPQLARYLVLLLSGFLAVFSVASLTRLSLNPDLAVVYMIYASLMLIASILMLVCYFWLGQKSKRAFQVTVTILILNIVLTIFDQIGAADLVFMLLNAGALALLYTSRNEFIHT